MSIGKRLGALWLLLVAAVPLQSLAALAAIRQQENTRASSNPALSTANDKRFIIILQSSSDPLEQLKASIPAEFQDFEVFNARRVSEGKTLYDICLGHFATLAEAERAQRTLLRRFPNASVIPVKRQNPGIP